MRQRSRLRRRSSCQASSGSDARTAVDEVGFGATLFTRPITSQVELVRALLSGTGFYPVQMGELPHLRRPGDARAEESKVRKAKKKRRWVR
jgi:hypothetical protein